MDAIDNRTPSSPSVGALSEEDQASASATARQDLDTQIAEKEIATLQQEQQQQRVLDARPTTATPDSGTEWDPWKFMVLRH